jgi:flagellin
MSNYQGNSKALTNNLEKLSSGYRINSAADDAAGLAISEKMRSQIAGLQKAQDNANDGISLVQTAEGALTEVNSMLTRLTTLATQSANGTYDSEVDRANLQEETDAILAEIDRISESTNYNGINLLDGSLSEKGVKVTEATVKVGGSTITAMSATQAKATNVQIEIKQASTTSAGQAQTYTFTYTNELGKTKTASVAFETGATSAATIKNLAEAINKDANLGKNFTASASEDGSKLEIRSLTTASSAQQGDITKAAAIITKVKDSTVGSTAGKTTITGDDTDITPTSAGVTGVKYYNLNNLDDGDVVTINGTNYTFRSSASNVKLSTDFHTAEQLASMSDAITVDATNASLKSVGVMDQFENGATLTLQVGDTNKSYQKVDVDVRDMSSTGLGLRGLDISTQDAAAESIDRIKEAVNVVSTQRGKLGALANRLEHTLNNLDATEQNITAAESQIRDVDMAKEMTQYSKNNILVQAAQSMLAQANSLPQGVLSLLQ